LSLLAILAAIHAAGEAQVQEIELRAYRQVQNIQSEARFEAEHVREDARTAALAPASRERARIIHRARLTGLQLIGNVRESYVDAALDQTRGRLAGIRSHPAYPKVLHSLTQEALAELESSLKVPGTAGLEADPRDKELLEIILFDMGLDLNVKYDLHCWGGVVAKSQDSRVVVINTLEARLERAAPYLRHFLAAFIENQKTELDQDWIGEKTIAA
jgi:vacuolar-type H+-ATPase subunit E/Vma4